jgi:hypothetical protein
MAHESCSFLSARICPWNFLIRVTAITASSNTTVAARPTPRLAGAMFYFTLPLQALSPPVASLFRPSGPGGRDRPSDRASLCSAWGKGGPVIPDVYKTPVVFFMFKQGFERAPFNILPSGAEGSQRVMRLTVVTGITHEARSCA